ncbi:unnamed protein product [Polarella glacialis]|uniref:Uncharacterized protein n=1 Tax=Polarella glacialis TaxID=89957 RepID=A0A813H965_POLGL|nr:unnamed protein product [Polarella glacialis]CAE8634224.1 unnamed protein product [Polarella glacialis]CAE8711641.1 unnamed protein product [Polarella glacialis]
MAAAQSAKFSFLTSHGGPGSRKDHNHAAVTQAAPARVRSLPQLGIPAGFSGPLGNKLGLMAYTNLRAPYNARLDVPMHESNPRAKKMYVAKVEELWMSSERIRPETMTPAGVLKERPRGKKMVEENTNSMSHVGSLIRSSEHGDRSGGMLKQADSQIYQGSAGLNAKAERTPIYGHTPPVCLRTFGEDGPTAWDSQVRIARYSDV